MLRHEEASRVEQQHALARVPAEYLRRAIRPIHSGADDDRGNGAPPFAVASSQVLQT